MARMVERLFARIQPSVQDCHVTQSQKKQALDSRPLTAGAADPDAARE
jgi:hypothetical protein